MPSPRTSRSRPSIRGRRPRRTARSPATDNSSKARSNATEPTRSCRRKAPARARSSTRRPWPRRPLAAARPILEPALLRSKRSEASGNIMPDGPQTPASRGLRIVAITADADFEQSLRATFGRSAQVDLAVVAGAVGGTEEKLPLADATVLLVDLDATRSDEIAALQNLARRLAGSVPILVVTAGFSESVARQLIQLRIADFLVKPVDPVELVRACGRVAKSSAADGATGGRDLHVPARGRRSGRDDAGGGDGDAAHAPRAPRRRLDLPGRSRFPARRLRRLSRYRAAPRHRRDRAAAGAARRPIAGSDALPARLRSCGNRRAEPPGRNAFVRCRRRHAPTRHGVLAVRPRRDRHAADLVRLDRQRPAGLEPAVRGHRDDGPGRAPRDRK